MFKILAISFLAVSAVFAASLTHIPTDMLGEAYNQKPSALVGERVAAWSKKSLVNPEELGTYFEGDLLNPIFFSSRSIVSNTAYRWPNKTVIYAILEDSGFKNSSLSLISQAMTAIANSTCIQFKERTTEAGYVVFRSNGSGCWSSLGYSGKVQTINLQQDGCTTNVGTAIHEILHTLGFYHEHTRVDRDDFVTLNTTNIQTSAMGNFNKESGNKTSTGGIAYDLGSVMHYSAYAFAKDSKFKTIQNNTVAIGMGQRRQLSPIDIQRVNAAYNCDA